MEINVLVDDGIALRLAWLEGLARQVLAAEKAGPGVELGLYITRENRVRELNRIYRGIDEPTDVLAFAAEESDAALFVTPPDGVQHLGEVIISYPQAVMQAEEQQYPVEQEIALLIVHGVLHLLGYDHDGSEPESRMKAREAQILSSIEGGAA